MYFGRLHTPLSEGFLHLMARVPDFALYFPWAGVQLLALATEEVRLSRCCAVWAGCGGSILPPQRGLCLSTSMCSSNWNLAWPELPKPPPGTSWGQPACSLGRGSRNSWSQHCTNGQKTHGGPHSPGSLPGEVARPLGGIRLPGLRGHKCQAALPSPAPFNHTLPGGPRWKERSQSWGKGEKHYAAISNNSC